MFLSYHTLMPLAKSDFKKSPPEAIVYSLFIPMLARVNNSPYGGLDAAAVAIRAGKCYNLKKKYEGKPEAVCDTQSAFEKIEIYL